MKPLIDADTKKCRLCEETKLLQDFHPNKSCKLGVIGTCKMCYKVRVSKWYSDNRSKRRDYANTKNQQRKLKMVEHFGNKCHDCLQSYPQCVYEFHHLDSSQKDVNPSQALTWSEERMWRELQKCIMLCSNCHKIRHFSLGKGGLQNEAVN